MISDFSLPQKRCNAMRISFFCTLPLSTHSRRHCHCHPPLPFPNHGHLRRNVVCRPLIHLLVQVAPQDRIWLERPPLCDRILHMMRVPKAVMGQRTTSLPYAQMIRPVRLFILFHRLQRHRLRLRPCLQRDVRQVLAWPQGTHRGARGSAPPSKKILHRWVEMMMMMPILMAKLRIQMTSTCTALVAQVHLRGSGFFIETLFASPRILVCPVHDGDGSRSSRVCVSLIWDQ